MACTYTYYHYPSENRKKIGGHHAYFPSTPPQIGHFCQKTLFFPLLLFISYGKNNFTAVTLPVLIDIIIIHRKMEKKIGSHYAYFPSTSTPPQIGCFGQKT